MLVAVILQSLLIRGKYFSGTEKSTFIFFISSIVIIIVPGVRNDSFVTRAKQRGKTTSFTMLWGLIKPDSGNIYLDGVDVTDLPMYKRAPLGL